MINRYTNRIRVINDNKLYKKYFEDRDVKNIRQYLTQKFTYLSESELADISFYQHVWSSGDRLYKLSYRYYGNYNDWWIILFFNKLKNEVDIKAGDVLKIPINIENFILKILG